MIKDPEGGYSQLVRLQEGAREQEASLMDPISLDMSPHLERAMSRSASQRFSMRRSRSRGSSSGRHSISISFNVPGPVNIQETNEGDFYDDIDHDCERTNKPEEEKKREKSRSVSMRRLAYLNKPEVPILLLGSLAASIHGVIFPLFGYLISSAIKIFYEPAHLLRHDSTKWALVYVSLGVASLIAIPFQNFLFAIAGGKLIRRIRLMTFEKVVHQEVKWFDDPANSRFANSISNSKYSLCPIIKFPFAIFKVKHHSFYHKLSPRDCVRS